MRVFVIAVMLIVLAGCGAGGDAVPDVQYPNEPQVINGTVYMYANGQDELMRCNGTGDLQTVNTCKYCH